MKALFNILIIISLMITKSFAQLNPMGSIYFQNPYLANPALAGVANGWQVNAASKVQWTAIDGAPSMQSASATYGTENKKIGLGVNLYNENAGVFLRTILRGTYAYHLPLSTDNLFLDLGLSAGITSEWIDIEKVIGDKSDPAINLFNNRKSYMDGDFGIALRSNRLTGELSIPNLKRFLNRDLIRNTIDKSLFMAALSYQLSHSNFSMESKAVYRTIANFKDIVDFGIQFKCLEDKLLLSGIYHTTASTTFGIGTLYQKQLSILCMYTTGTKDLAQYSNGEFEIALKYHIR